jgi:hypothetical protein
MTSLTVVYKAVNIYEGLANSSVRGLAYASLIGRDKLLILDYILHLVGIL